MKNDDEGTILSDLGEKKGFDLRFGK